MLYIPRLQIGDEPIFRISKIPIIITGDFFISTNAVARSVFQSSVNV